MANPRIEEVSDSGSENDASDPEIDDLDAFDFAKPQAALQTYVDNYEKKEQQQQQQRPPTLNPTTTPGPPPTNLSPADRDRLAREQQQRAKHWQCIYPVYFDSTRSREDGRRVKKADAVPNPLAREIVEALHHIGNALGVQLQIIFEPSKCHPKDWANPGRVKVLIKEGGKAVSPRIKNKHYLLPLIAAHLQLHPTTEDSPHKLRIPGMPPRPNEAIPPPAIPRGFKMGTILPLHSPAMTGGGVSDNFFKDMMAEMQQGGGQLPEGMEGMAQMAQMAAAGGAGGGGGGGKKPKPIRVRGR